MHTHNFLLRTLPRCLLAAALAAGVTTTAIYAVDGDPPGLFELDGDTAPSNLLAGDDWDDVFLNNLTTPPKANTGILDDLPTIVGGKTSDQSIFTGGTSDTDDVDEWSYTTGSVPDKNEINNAYALGYTLPADVSHNGSVVHHAGDLVIYFGLDRYANNGDAQTGFWFFQQDVAPDGNGGFTGEHTPRTASGPGDLLVLVDYPQGANAIPVIRVLEWDPTDSDDDNVAANLDEIYNSSDPGSLPALCDGAGNKLVCAITNVDDLPGAPAWPYTPKKTGPTVFDGIPFESFFEGGINVSALLGGEVPCFSSFLAETRASSSETAELKDWVLGNFDLCSVAVTKECTAAVNEDDGGNSVVVSFDGEVTNTGALALDVTVTDDMGTPGDTGDDEVVFGPTTLQPGETQPYSSSFETLDVTSSDTVTAIGTRGSATVEATADAECVAPVIPAITVDKVCRADPVAGGTAVAVTFNGTVTNTGNVALKDVNVLDDSGTADPSDDVNIPLGNLDVGASVTYEGSFTLPGTNSSTDNVVASGVDVLTDKEVTANATASCVYDVIPEIAVTKVCTVEINAAGTGIDVEFSGLVTNIGQEALKDVMVVDDNGTPGNTADDVTVLGPIALLVGDSAGYSGGFSATGSNSSIDVVTASGTGVLSNTTVEVTAQADCDTPVIREISVTKQCTDAPAFDQPILFSGTVTNTGNVALLGVIVVDDNGTPADPSDDVTFPIGDLAPNGGTANYNGSYSPGPGTFTNTVVASGSDAILSQPASSSPASATCEVPPPPGDEGCTPGYWKSHLDSWVGYSPNQTLGSVFAIPASLASLANDSLLTALDYDGGGGVAGAARILLRAAVASLLNAANSDVDFPLTEAQVIAAVNAALATGHRNTILELATELDDDNKLGCPLN